MRVEASSVERRVGSLHSSQEQVAMHLVQHQDWKPQSIKEGWVDSVRYCIILIYFLNFFILNLILQMTCIPL